MTTDTLTSPAPTTGHPTSAVRSFRHVFVPDVAYQLLLAIENDDIAPAAIRLTDALAVRGAVPHVLRTLELMTPVAGVPETPILYAQAALGPDFYEEQRQTIASTIRTVLGADRKWPIKSVVGDPASAIIDEAEAENAELLVMGIHHHGAFAQALGENTATRVMSKAVMPVVGVRSTSIGLPRRILVATDFGNASVEAAHLAANLVHPDGVVILVHATLPVPVIEEGDEGAALVQREGIAQAFLHLSSEISKDRKIRVETVTRSGDAAAQLLAAAEEIAPDMIAIASQRHHLLTRLILGSVSRKLVREGRWSMLITPPTRTH
jgi:nucleotide-binding universal stress UspA family protein